VTTTEEIASRVAQLERELAAEREARGRAEAGRSEAHTRLGAEVRAHAETKRLAEAMATVIPDVIEELAKLPRHFLTPARNP
jgi:hypothetical protein